MLDFNFAPPQVSFFNLPENFCFLEISMISNATGELQCYTDGCSITNYTHQHVMNGDSLNPGKQYNTYCGSGIGYPTSQSSILLPLPNTNNIYYLFHIGIDDNLWHRFFYYTIIDMEKNDGLGEVILKNELFFSTYHFGQQITATRHANGRDWWIVIPHGIAFTSVPGNKYYKFLFSPDGLSGPYEQEIGEGWGFEYYSGQATFSPDGTKYARMNPFNGLRLFDFDRCIGGFSNPLSIHFPEDTIISGGVAFSPNSRFLFVSAGVKVYQFDTWAADIAGSRKTVAVYDGYMSPFRTLFYQQMLAPDGKIYITAPNSVDVLHIIHKPDLPGDACEFEQHGLQLPTLHSFCTPNFPHFRLYDVPGSPCDTLGIDGPVATEESLQGKEKVVSVFPNPTAGGVTVSLPAPLPGDAVWMLGDATGRPVQRALLPAGQQSVEVGLPGLPPGLYFWVLMVGGRSTGRGKLVVTR